MANSLGRRGLLAVGLAISCLAPSATRGQTSGGVLRRGVELELVGRVEHVFLSADRADDTRLVALALRSVSLQGADPPRGQLRIPAPGEVAYIVIAYPRGAATSASDALPRVGDTIRGAVESAGRGQWRAVGADWYERIEHGDRPPGGGAPGEGQPLVELRGMSCQPQIVQGQLALAVVRVDRRGPAQEAGLQAGDVIVGIGGQPIVSLASVVQAAQGSKPLELSVVDVNTGRVARVSLGAAISGAPQTAPRDREPGSSNANANANAKLARALGITVEATRVGLGGAVKVATVEPGKPGAAAGLEPGDVIVAVDDARIADAAEFARALSNRGGRVTLIVRDVRSGREVPVEVLAVANDRVLREAEPPPLSPPANAGATDRLGLSTELTFYEAEAAVRVVSVKPGSPASRAGVRPGLIILEVNDAAVMRPEDLTNAEASGGRLELRAVDPTNKRELTIAIDP